MKRDTLTYIPYHSLHETKISPTDSKCGSALFRLQRQNVNKVATAIHLRFDINASSLPDFYKERLLKLNDHRITQDGSIIIKAQEYRSQLKNKEDALDRLKKLIKSAMVVKNKRKPTKPTVSSQQKRVDNKKKRSQVKNNRRKVEGE